MFDRQPIPTELPESTVDAFVPIKTTADTSSEIVYVDPHFVVLLFLLGFCLLYACIVAVDALSRPAATGEDDSETTSRWT